MRKKEKKWDATRTSSHGQEGRVEPLEYMKDPLRVGAYLRTYKTLALKEAEHRVTVRRGRVEPLEYIYIPIYMYIYVGTYIYIHTIYVRRGRAEQLEHIYI